MSSGHGRRAGGGDDSAAGQRVAAEWLGRHRQRAGGSPAFGTSEESTAGGVDSRYGHAAASGAAFGSAVACGMPTSAGAANIANAATKENARVENIREVAIVSAD